MAAQKTVLVTGANKGLGLAIIQNAATRDPSCHYFLGCRDTEAGAKAIDELKQKGIVASLELLKLDTTNDADITAAVQHIDKAFGKLDVLINNAGIARIPQDQSLPALRAAYTEMLMVNVTSVACMCQAFQPLLKLSSNPKVINITSGLASITNSLTKPMQRAAPYGTSKVALNGLTAHLQVAENDRARERGNTVAGSKINYYAVAPGFLKTALTRFHERGKDPLQGAEAVVEILHSDEFPGGTQLEMEGGKLREIPW